MTALKPIENRNIRGVASERYPINVVCAHPNCIEKAESVHHIFPRSMTRSDSWFVAIRDEEREQVFPHAVGLCGSGTTGHHGDLEEHRAWIKLEDGVFVWYDLTLDTERTQADGHINSSWATVPEAWYPLGPLNPQPAQQGKPKRRRNARTPAEVRARKVVTIKVPKGEENLITERAEMMVERFAEEMGWSDSPPLYNVLLNALDRALELGGG